MHFSCAGCLLLKEPNTAQQLHVLWLKWHALQQCFGLAATALLCGVRIAATHAAVCAAASFQVLHLACRGCSISTLPLHR